MTGGFFETRFVSRCRNPKRIAKNPIFLHIALQFGAPFADPFWLQSIFNALKLGKLKRKGLRWTTS